MGGQVTGVDQHVSLWYRDLPVQAVGITHSDDAQSHRVYLLAIIGLSAHTRSVSQRGPAAKLRTLHLIGPAMAACSSYWRPYGDWFAGPLVRAQSCIRSSTGAGLTCRHARCQVHGATDPGAAPPAALPHALRRVR